MRFKGIIALKNELNTQIDKYANEIEVSLYPSLEGLKQAICKDRAASLLIAATDSTIAYGKECGIATMAYANPELLNQTYRGVDMIVEGFEEVDVDFLERVYQRYHRIPWTILETERCVVRELCLEDLDELFALYEDGEIDKYTEPLYPYEEEKEFQRAYIENMYRYFGYGMWLVFSKETGKLIGRAGLEHREYHEEIELELGYIIGTAYQGQGYATEVCKAILEYAKEHTGFERINTLIEDGNIASEKLSKKLGFVHAEDFELDGKIMHRYIRNLDF
ncbi:MAG: GNAT family N-acetyltransferase [Agathobacter sp.]|nr:GNAT family N-acetyltransferase [Agathobacter sp.]